MREFEIRLLPDNTSFGYRMSLFSETGNGYLEVVTGLTIENIEPGERINIESLPLVSERSLERAGMFLIGQGVLQPPLTQTEQQRLLLSEKTLEYKEKEVELLKQRIEDLQRLYDAIK